MQRFQSHRSAWTPREAASAEVACLRHATRATVARHTWLSEALCASAADLQPRTLVQKAAAKRSGAATKGGEEVAARQRQ
mmetsp:Transcript_57291/g.127876  ORF Transcript_57291/g.127876 Transcript_57291/m.127876 type:complete len:80 (-) Transcript_57291:125-364(-)